MVYILQSIVYTAERRTRGFGGGSAGRDGWPKLWPGPGESHRRPASSGAGDDRADAETLNSFVDRHPAPDAEIYTEHIVAAMAGKRLTHRNLVADDCRRLRGDFRPRDRVV